MNITGPLIIGLLLSIAAIAVNEWLNLFRHDRFPTPLAKWLGYGLITLYACGLAVLIGGAAGRHATAEDVKNLPFWSLFAMHILLLIFLFVWWLLTGRPKVTSYLNLYHADPVRTGFTGIAVGVGAWALTIVFLAIVGIVLQNAKLLPNDLKPSPLIPWMAALSVWKKMLVVCAAMTVEEFFFRGFLQKRFGLVVSTILFALAHAGYGQPLLMVGVTVVSIVIGVTFYRTKNLWPCIIAHGVFDAIQLFVIVPVALKLGGMGFLGF